MTVDDLPESVLTELGRVTWAAINLESYIQTMCSFIQPSNPREDRRSVGKKIKDARRVLSTWPPSNARKVADAWLLRAETAMEARNAAMHATPLTWIGPRHPDQAQQFLGEMPRRTRPYVERPLTIESLSDLKAVLAAGTDGWRDVALAVAEEEERLRHSARDDAQ